MVYHFESFFFIILNYPQYPLQRICLDLIEKEITFLFYEGFLTVCVCVFVCSDCDI